MKQLVLLSLAATLCAETGLRPRPSASDYAAHESGAGATIAATVLSPDQARKLFAVDLNKLGYTVVEIAVYPDRDVEVAARDFLLRIGQDGSTVRPATPSTIAGRLHRKDSPPPKIPERVQVYGGQTVGYGTGGPYNRGGVYTESTVGVAVGAPGPPPPPPRSSKGKDTDSLSVQVDLENQALPDGRFNRPVAGYLYFPATPKKSAVEITWYGADGQVRLPMPPTK
jgi:hypothetical protein